MTIKSIGIVVAGLAIAIIGYLSWLEFRDPRVTIRYRLTLELEADGKPVSGSSVMEMTVVRGLSNLGAPYGRELRGEAIAVDLGQHGLLFGILRSQTDTEPPISMLPDRVFERVGLMPSANEIPKDKLNVEGVWRLEQVPEETGEIELLPSEIPQLVRFDDINNAATAELVSSDSLSRLYDGKVRFSRATLARTGESLTEKISVQIPQIFASLEQFNNVVIDPRPIDSLRLGTGDFKRSR